jgi:hypothetical protein
VVSRERRGKRVGDEQVKEQVKGEYNQPTSPFLQLIGHPHLLKSGFHHPSHVLSVEI